MGFRAGGLLRPALVLRLAGVAVLAAVPRAAMAAPAVETIVFVRHGEKPPRGLGQLDCRGLNRSLALPSVLAAKFGTPAAVFAPNPSKQKEDDGKAYDYVRPLATIEPTAIRFGLPVDTTYGFTEIDKLRAALEQPDYRTATVVVAWEHKLIDAIVKDLVAAHGGDAAAVPKWHGKDFDGIYVVRIDWGAQPPSATFATDREGLDGQPDTCLHG